MIKAYKELREKGRDAKAAYQELVDELAADVQALEAYQMALRWSATDEPIKGILNNEREFFRAEGFEQLPAERALNLLGLAASGQHGG